jgi:hypothetical protein
MFGSALGGRQMRTLKSFMPSDSLCALHALQLRVGLLWRRSRMSYTAPEGWFWSATLRSWSIALSVASHEFMPTFPAQEYATPRHVPQDSPA